MTQTPVSTAPGDLSIPKALTPEDHTALQRAYAADGYVVLKNVVDRAKLTSLCTTIVDAFDDPKRSGGLFAGGGLISGHLNGFPGEGTRFVYEALQERGVIDLIKAITPLSFVSPSVR